MTAPPRVCVDCSGPNLSRYRRCDACRCAPNRKPCRACGQDKGAGARSVFCGACLQAGAREMCCQCRERPATVRMGGKASGNLCRECKNDREYARRGKPCRRCGSVKVIDRSGVRGKGLCGACRGFCPGCLANPRAERSHGYCADCRQKRQRALCLRRSYGLSLREWEDLYRRQDGACAICLASFPSLEQLAAFSALRRDVATDHCHRTGRVRGLLCNGCNLGIGLMKDNADALRRAAAYLAAS